jgi:hypothetical protein
MPVTPPPITGRWDPHKVGRRVVAIGVVLLVLSVGAGLWRLINADNAPAVQDRNEDSTGTNGTGTFGAAKPTIEVPSGLVGMSFDDARAALEDADLRAERKDVTAKDVAPDTVVDVSPDEGSEAKSGDTITLFVSEPEKTKPAEEHGPGKGKGHDKGKGKKH